jgi:predicted TIM-barrel fold metal-dependent hydrolase
MSAAPQHTLPAAGGCDCHVHVFEAGAPVRPGHYLPMHRPVGDIERAAAALGVSRLVLVQPSVYGSDHRVLLHALRASGGRHRGVAVVDAEVSDAALDELHAAGVRGIRFNRVSPAAPPVDVASCLRALAPRLRARGWHVQWYVAAPALPELAALQRDTGLSFVLDHLGGVQAALPAASPLWAALQALADGGAWLKLSGWYRLGAAAPYDSLGPQVQRLARMFGARTVWGSDWPHTSFQSHALPDYAATWAPVVQALGPAAADAILRQHAARLYDFPLTEKSF